MVVIRPVSRSDLDKLVELASKAGFGLTSLPKDSELLEKRIAQSEQSFRLELDRPGGELYMFVMEEEQTGDLAGTSCIVSKVGGFEPFYAFQIQTHVHESKHLAKRREIPTLYLVALHSGPCEIGGLFLAPDYRKHGNGRLLSLFRFLFMTDFPGRFEETVIAEMRGVVDQDGRSPFWEALGRHFFDMDFPKADYLSVKDKQFIADLMPTCPIYIPLLPQEAQEVIGKVHKDTEPALKMLQDEGFLFGGMVDIFEAGPVISAKLPQIRIARESRSALVKEVGDEPIDSPQFIVTNSQREFRACIAAVDVNADGGVRLESSAAEALRVRPGDRVRFGPLRPPRHHVEAVDVR
jgi:arginine N-succinyltransferase